ncbi:MAG: hypothetical protein HYZ44_08070 [Bacteroidetes bacterium]|nr:hypothetical protein [Bacteroidota bacterium]
METHKRILSILFIVHGVLQAIGMLFVSLFLSAFLPFIISEADQEAREVLELVLPFIQFIGFGIIALFSIPSIAGGIALLNGKKWALTLLLIYVIIDFKSNLDYGCIFRYWRSSYVCAR